MGICLACALLMLGVVPLTQQQAPADSPRLQLTNTEISRRGRDAGAHLTKPTWASSITTTTTFWLLSLSLPHGRAHAHRVLPSATPSPRWLPAVTTAPRPPPRLRLLRLRLRLLRLRLRLRPPPRFMKRSPGLMRATSTTTIVRPACF